VACHDPVLATDDPQPRRAAGGAACPLIARSREELLAARLAPHRPRLRRQARGAAGRRPDLPVYFVNTHSRLAKTGENTNGFIQKYILKGTKIPVSLEYQ